MILQHLIRSKVFLQHILEKRDVNQKKGSFSQEQKEQLEILLHCQILQTSQYWKALPYLNHSVQLKLFHQTHVVIQSDIQSSEIFKYAQSIDHSSSFGVDTTSKSMPKLVSLNIYFECNSCKIH